MRILITLFILFLCECLTIDLDIWEQFDDHITYLAINGPRMMKVGDTGPTSEGKSLYSWSSLTQSWTLQTGVNSFGIQVALSQDYAFSRDTADDLRVQQITNSDFSSSLFGVKDIKPTNGNEIICVKTDSFSGGDFEVELFDLEFFTTTPVNIGAIKISATLTGRIWLITGSGDIYNDLPGSFMQVSGTARDIFMGNDDIPYIVSEDPDNYDFIIKKWNNVENDWDDVPGIAGVSLALDFTNNLYVITSDNKAFRRRGLTYSFCPGKNKINSYF